MASRKFLTVTAASTLLACLACTAVAQDKEAVMKMREQTMKTMGGAMQATGKFVKNEGGTVDDVKAAAARLTEAASKDPASLFPPGSTGGDSRSKPEIWTSWDVFAKQWADLKPAAAKLTEAAASGDRQQIAAAMGGVGKACGTCHDQFRAPKQ
jgi:cytochrome c556